jgi:hypothetical protein
MQIIYGRGRPPTVWLSCLFLFLSFFYFLENCFYVSGLEKGKYLCTCNERKFEILNKIMVALFTSSLHMKCTDGESYINKRKCTLED